MMEDNLQSDFHWLLEAQAEALLAETVALFEAHQNALTIAKRLRKQVTATRSAMVMEQAQLQIRGRIKFALADRMRFTRRGLEQASGWDLARYKARQFRECPQVADVCCGIGGDLIELAGRFLASTGESPIAGGRTPEDESRTPIAENESPVADGRTLGIDVDPVTALFASHNLQEHIAYWESQSRSTPPARVDSVDFSAVQLEDFDGLHLDPDRRAGKRTVLGTRFSPPLDEIYQRLSNCRLVAIKVAPATPRQDYIPESAHREWIGDRRECKQQVLWTGTLNRKPGQRTATVVLPDASCHQISATESQADDVRAPVWDSDHLLPYLYEPHPAVIAAGLTDYLADQYCLYRSCRDIPFLLADEPVDDPMLTRFRILHVCRLDQKRLVDILRELNVGELEVKCRGIDQVTASRFAKLKLDGDQRATLILTKLGENRTRRALIATRAC